MLLRGGRSKPGSRAWDRWSFVSTTRLRQSSVRVGQPATCCRRELLPRADVSAPSRISHDLGVVLAALAVVAITFPIFRRVVAVADAGAAHGLCIAAVAAFAVKTAVAEHLLAGEAFCALTCRLRGLCDASAASARQRRQMRSKKECVMLQRLRAWGAHQTSSPSYSSHNPWASALARMAIS